MASLSTDGGGNRTIQFVGVDRRRRSIRLGKVSKKQAEMVKFRVEQLAAGVALNAPPDADAARWIAKLPDDLHEKLATVGLIEPRASSSLGAFLDDYFRIRADVKPITRVIWGQAKRNLIDFFGCDKPLRQITEGDAEEWRLTIVAEGLSDPTVRKRASFAKQFFAFAVKKGLIDRNPFVGLKSSSASNPKRFYFVTREETQVVLDACPDAEWRLIVALARYGGLRCPSEHYGLKWSDIDWERGRMTVTSPKTEHHEGKETRLTPLFPELRPYLDDVWELAEPGAEFVLAR